MRGPERRVEERDWRPEGIDFDEVVMVCGDVSAEVLMGDRDSRCGVSAGVLLDRAAAPRIPVVQGEVEVVARLARDSEAECARRGEPVENRGASGRGPLRAENAYVSGDGHRGVVERDHRPGPRSRTPGDVGDEEVDESLPDLAGRVINLHDSRNWFGCLRGFPRRSRPSSASPSFTGAS